MDVALVEAQDLRHKMLRGLKLFLDIFLLMRVRKGYS
jgi:hypothetical protein